MMTRLTNASQPAAFINKPGVASASHAFDRAFKLARSLHEAGSEPVEQKRRLLAALCAATGASEGIAAVTQTNLASGRREIISVTAIRMIANTTSLSKPPNRTPSAVNNTKYDPVHLSPVESDVVVPAGHCLDDFVWLDGLKLCASVTLSKPQNCGKFDAADHLFVERAHAGCRFIYAHDLHLACFTGSLPSVDRRVIQDFVAGHSVTSIASRWRLKAVVVRQVMDSCFKQLSVQSRDELLQRWSVPT